MCCQSYYQFKNISNWENSEEVSSRLVKLHKTETMRNNKLPTFENICGNISKDCKFIWDESLLRQWRSDTTLSTSLIAILNHQSCCTIQKQIKFCSFYLTFLCSNNIAMQNLSVTHMFGLHTVK